VTVDVVVRAEAEEDLRALGSNKLRLEAVKLIVALKIAPRLGRPLEHNPQTGDLSDCRKLYFDNARHRIVYRLLPSERKPTTVDVIAVGPREALEVYEAAVERLGRGAA
jgi:ParE toxin of type II toxin-antitoxin system, parDE